MITKMKTESKSSQLLISGTKASEAIIKEGQTMMMTIYLSKMRIMAEITTKHIRFKLSNNTSQKWEAHLMHHSVLRRKQE
jgi:hypothetical protein